MKHYAGIGSRETPDEFCKLFENIAKFLSERGYTLRSGGANGADKAFEKGCTGEKEIYLPWSYFENNSSNLVVSNKVAFDIAKKFHPYWDKLSLGGQKLQARNSCQVLGYNFDTPSDFILCWTKNGKGSGGTGQAIRIAKAYDIPVIDFGKYDDLITAKDSFLRIFSEIELKLYTEGRK